MKRGTSVAASAGAAVPGLPGCRSVAWWVLLLLVMALPSGLCAQMSVQPVILELRTSQGAASASFVVRNRGVEPLPMQVYASDFEQHQDGGHTFLASGEHERSCSERLQFFPESFEVPADGTQEVRVTMAPGARTCWSLVFAQTVPRSDSGVTVAQRIGVKVYGVDQVVRPEGELRSVSLEPDTTGGMLLQLEFENLGEDPLRPEGELEVRTLQGDVLGVAPIPGFSVLPGRVRSAAVSVQLDLPAGEYLAIPILDFGGDYLAGGQALFRIPGG